MKRPGVWMHTAIRPRHVLLAAGILALMAGPFAGALEPGFTCPASENHGYVCGAERPEDLARIPGTRWLIASGFSQGAGLKLVDSQSKRLEVWYTGAQAQIAARGDFHPACRQPPDAALFNAQGISLRSRGSDSYTLYVANHGGREGIEVFTVNAALAKPTLTWNGCVPMPDGLAANSVTSFSDGTILATVLSHPGTSYADFVNGRNTGGVYQWRPGETAFELLPGTELPGNNGIEASRDDRHFHVVAFGLHAIVTYRRDNTSKPVSIARAPGFMPDNIHWDGTQLVTAGMMADEPACGGRRKIIDGVADGMRCHRGYVVAQFDPANTSFRVIAYAEPLTDFNGVSAAVMIEDEIWLGSYQADRLAYRKVPAAPGRKR